MSNHYKNYKQLFYRKMSYINDFIGTVLPIAC
jgi:hypothetical protein